MQLSDVRDSLKPLAALNYTFRGETCPRTAIRPTLGRLHTLFPDEPERTKLIRAQAYTILRRTHRIRSQILPEMTQDEWYALLRHYGWPVALLDVTFDPEVAIWFALNKRKPDSEPSVIYAVPPSAVPTHVRVISHNDLKRDPEYLTLNCRWTVQQGGALVPTGWPDMTAAEQFDLLALPGLQSFEFTPAPTDRARDDNLMSTEGDGIASRLTSVLGIVSQVVGGLDAVDPYIRNQIESLG
jgi:hypothetical protein